MIYKTVKRSLCFLSFLFPSFVSTNAQNTLSLAANLMQPGDSVTKERVEYVYSGEYGNHAVWDFSNLETEDIYCIKYDTISESQLIGYDMQKTYNYRFTNDSLLMTGYESPLFSVDYVQPLLIHPFPLQLNQTYSADYQGDGRYCGTHFERNFGSVRITADAIGTLILSEKDTLPNTLRVYTINTEAIRLNRDSCRNDSDNLKLVITEQHQWYARGYRYPVFETITSSTYDNMNHVATQQYAYRCPPIVQEVLNDSVNEQIRINDRLAGNISDDFGNNKNNPVVNNGENSNSESPNDVDSNFTYEIQTDGNRVTITYDIKTKSNVHAMVVDVLGSINRDVQQTNQAGNGYVMNIDCTGLRRGQYIIYINVNGTIFSKKNTCQMKRIYFCTTFLFLTFTFVNSQQMKPVDIPTPQAANLGQYDDISISYYTGKADISIPLYSFTLRDVTLPISLSYDNGGVLINSLPGWTGHNWTLSAGGAITRVVQGRYDEYLYPYGAMLTYPSYNYFQSYGAINRLIQQPENNYEALRDSVTYGTVDLAPDIFYFNFMNISGRFFLGNDGEWKVDCNQNIEVVFDYKDNSNFILPFIEDFPYQYAVDQQPKTIKGFMLRDDRGNKYYFGGNTDAIEYRTDFFRMTEAENFASWIANTWYLTKVTDRHDNILYTFSYQRDRFMAQVFNNLEAFKVSNSQYWIGGSYGNSYSSIDYTYPYLVEINAPVRLRKIFLADGRVVTFFFNNINNTTETFYPSYYNSNAPYALKQLRPNPSNGLLYYYLQTEDSDIKQYQANASFIDKFNDPLIATGISLLNKICLNYGSEGVFNYNLEYDMGNFPMLRAIKIMNEAVHYNSQASIGTYRMKYNGLNQLPTDHLSRAVDHWGYFNGSPYSNPYTTAEFATFKSRRDPNPQYCQLGLLQELIYPTGGSSVFEYESNDYSQYQSLDRQSLVSSNGIGGGMRIKSITEYEDTIHTKVLKKRTFTYKIPGTTTSSGQLYATPIYYWPNWTPCDTYGGNSISQSYFRNMPIVPLSNSFGPYVGYSYIEETFLDGSRNLYHYLNISDCHDQKFVYDFNNGQISPFDRFGERFYGRGKLKYEEQYAANGDKVQKKVYWYNNVYESNYSVLTSNLTWENNGNSGSFSHYNGGIYKLFYPRRFPIQESTTTYFSTDSIVETKAYSIAPKTLTVQYGNYNHSVEIYQLDRIYSYRDGAPSFIQDFSYTNDSNEPLMNILATNQFFLPEISYQKSRNNVVSEKRVTKYALYAGKILPKCVLGLKGGTVMDTLISYKAYTPTGQLSRYREQGKPIVQLIWVNNDNFITAKNEGQNHLTTYTYNDKWQIQKITLPNGNYNSYLYDDFGRLIEIRNRSNEWLKKFSYNYKNK